MPMAKGTIGEKVRAMRRERGWSQEQLSDRAVGVSQSLVSRIENGTSRVPLDAARSIAAAFGVDPSELLDGTETDRTRLSEPSGFGYGRDPRTPEDDETPLESALFAVMDPKKYKVPVFDAARRVIRETFRFTREDADLEAQARSYLEAAARLHREGKPMTTAAILSYVINGSLPGAEEVARERAAAVNAKADEELRAKGMEPGQGAERLKAAVARRTGKGG